MENRITFEAIGTSWEISTDIPLTQSVQEKIKERIHLFDTTYSRFRSDSLVAEIARKKGKYTFPSDARPLFLLYEQLYTLTDGDFTPCIGQLLVDAGYDADYSLQPKKLQHVPSWEECMHVSFPHILVKRPIMLDFGAAGKGYLADIVGEILLEEGISSFCINAAGDIVYRSNQEKKLRVGLEHPKDFTKVIGVVDIGNESICGSAGNRRVWSNFHHIMHPKTKTPIDEIIAAWVIAKDGLLADGLATALFFVTPEVLQDTFDFSYILLKKDYSVEKSKDLSATFF